MRMRIYIRIFVRARRPTKADEDFRNMVAIFREMGFELRPAGSRFMEYLTFKCGRINLWTMDYERAPEVIKSTVCAHHFIYCR